MLVINLWGGPGAGKSTIAAELFVCLRKHTNANVELVNEFATDLCFERAKENLKDQVYLLGNQWHRLWRFEQVGVDVAISDSPIGIGIPYIRKRKPAYFDQYVALVKSLYNEHLNTNIFVERDIYATGGFKGNSPAKNNSGFLRDLDRQIKEIAEPLYTVTYNLGAGQEVFDYVKPMVESYLENKDKVLHES
jgi:hypothetical protein